MQVLEPDEVTAHDDQVHPDAAVLVEVPLGTGVPVHGEAKRRRPVERKRRPLGLDPVSRRGDREAAGLRDGGGLVVSVSMLPDRSITTTRSMG